MEEIYTLISKWFHRRKKPSQVVLNGQQKKGNFRKFLSKISGSFMLPISVMAIAGLFLGVGATIATQAKGGVADATNAGVKFGQFIQMLGDPIFAAMPILFAAAIVVAFTDEAGVGVFAAIIGFLIFSSLQSIFIDEVVDQEKQLVGYRVLFEAGGRDAASLKNLVGSNLGIRSLNTSVFGGIIVGAITAFLYNRFHTIQLPQVISFFGGKRFVSLIVIVAMVPLAFLFLLLWPWVGKALSVFGRASGKIPYGFDSFIFGYVERSLIPFGLHHVFYAPLWWSDAGGNGLVEMQNWIDRVKPAAGQGNWEEFFKLLKESESKSVGDSLLWITVNSFHSNTVSWVANGQSHELAVFDFVSRELGIRLGRFMQGKFGFMILALPAAGVAMVLAAPRENRKVALGTVFPACLTAFLTGVTEPIEFTFLFLAPWLYWGFHALMAAISFWLMNLFGAHIGMTFSGGALDLIIYGAIPVAKGTYFWWAILIGLVYIPIYFFAFYFAIKRFNLPTPGRGENAVLYTKADYQAQQSSRHGPQPGQSTDRQVNLVVEGFGGWDNIKTYTNCASRLRYDVYDPAKVNESKFKQAGAFGVQRVGQHHYQIIFGPASEQINAKIMAARGKTMAVSTPTLEKQKTASSETVKLTKIDVKGVVPGRSMSLKSLKDGVFSEKIMGDGLAIMPKVSSKQIFYAPISGKLVTVFPTGHAYGIQNSQGVSVLVHIGIDTVNLRGEGFKSLVRQDQVVTAGDPLAEVNLTLVKKKAPSIATVVVLTPDSKGKAKQIMASGQNVNQASTIFKVS